MNIYPRQGQFWDMVWKITGTLKVETRRLTLEGSLLADDKARVKSLRAGGNVDISRPEPPPIPDIEY